MMAGRMREPYGTTSALVRCVLIAACVLPACAVRADNIFDDNWAPPPPRKQTRPAATEPAAPPPATRPAAEPAANPQLEDALRRWRVAEAKRLGVPAFRILTDRALRAIATTRPVTAAELLAIPGIGIATVEKYGHHLYRILNNNP